jgi:hypothetical protein
MHIRYTILARNSEVNTSLKRPRNRWENNTKMYF